MCGLDIPDFCTSRFVKDCEKMDDRNKFSLFRSRGRKSTIKLEKRARLKIQMKENEDPIIQGERKNANMRKKVTAEDDFFATYEIGKD